MKLVSYCFCWLLWLSAAPLAAQLSVEEDTEVHLQAGSYLIANGMDVNLAPDSRTTNQGFIITDQNLLAEGTLFTTVSGSTPGTHFGRWTGAITLELDGTLIAVRDLNYQPLDRATHKLLVTNNLIGEFETTILPGENWAFEYEQVSGLLIFDPALPVDWLSFNARVAEEDVVLNWQTAREANTAYFAVERLIGHGSWEEIGQVTAAGNSTETQNYNFTDRRAPAGIRLYYRLRQVDLDGRFDYSVTRSALLDRGRLALYPNPGPGPFYLSGPVAEGTPIYLHDLNGRLVFQTRFNSATGEMELLLPFDLPAATYRLEVEGFPAFLLYFRR